jgi:hypothetical protein
VSSSEWMAQHCACLHSVQYNVAVSRPIIEAIEVYLYPTVTVETDQTGLCKLLTARAHSHMPAHRAQLSFQLRYAIKSLTSCEAQIVGSLTGTTVVRILHRRSIIYKPYSCSNRVLQISLVPIIVSFCLGPVVLQTSLFVDPMRLDAVMNRSHLRRSSLSC